MNIDSPVAFIDAFRPPAGYKLGWIVGTTFTLDLTCLVQLALTTSNYKQNAEEINAASAFAAFTEFSNRATIFFQQARIKDLRSNEAFHSDNYRRLFTLLDQALVAVSVDHFGTCFHPKVWLVHYESTEPCLPPITRLSILSRNLTQDMSWDIGFTTDGKAGEADVELLAFLREMHDQLPVGDKARKRMVKAIETVRHLSFKLPEKAKSLAFSYQSPKRTFSPTLFGKFNELIVVSPFLGTDTIGKLVAPGGKVTVITGSRDADKALQLMKTSSGFKSNCFLMTHEKTELHAKIYVGRRDDGLTHMILGSANATAQGLGLTRAERRRNTEAVAHFTYPAIFFGQFLENFVIDKPWLQEITIDSRIEPNPVNEIEDLFDNVRNQIELGHFELTSKGRGKFGFKFSSKHEYELPKGIAAEIEILNSGYSEQLLRIWNKPSVIVLNAGQFSRLIRINLKFKGEKTSFLTTAETNFDFSLRRKAAIEALLQTDDDFISLLNSALGIFDYADARSQKRDKKAPTAKGLTSSRLMWREIETLLLNIRDEASIAALDEIFVVRQGRSKSPDALYEAWSAIKKAWKNVNGSAA